MKVEPSPLITRKLAANLELLIVEETQAELFLLRRRVKVIESKANLQKTLCPINGISSRSHTQEISFSSGHWPFSTSSERR